jgi:hypothetical protein
MQAANKVSPLAFFVGKVQRAFSNKTSLMSVNLEDYITDTRVTSYNGDLILDHKDGYLLINTEQAQGITGFFSHVPTDFNDVIIRCSNEYGAIVVVSLDDKALRSSEKILIQCMTEEMPRSYTTSTVTEKRGPNGMGRDENEIINKKLITNKGGDYLQVRNIEASVVLKGFSSGYAAALDENGYAKQILNPITQRDGLLINIPQDAVYVVFSKTPLTVQGRKQTNITPYIWWEGEDFFESSFPDKDISPFSPKTASGDDDFSVLSGGDWLSLSYSFDSSTRVYAKYNIEVSRTAEYTLYSRKYWLHGPFRWRFDNDEWQNCGTNLTLLDTAEIRKYLGANWVYLGETKLNAGTHVFEIELTADPSRVNGRRVQYVAGFDCFLLTTELFTGTGKVKPDEAKPIPNTGYFPFDPPHDYFDGAVLDFRYLNEATAGQEGFVKALGENFILPNGEKIRFWGVNTGHETLNASNKTLEYLAKSLAKRGVNLIRIHGAAFEITERKAVVDPDKLERLHYFIQVMKNEGIYVHLSVYFPLWYRFGVVAGYPAYDKIDNKHPFALLQFDKDFQSAYKDVLHQVFNSISPYTGLAIKDEPAVAFFEIQNEDSYFFWSFNPDNIPNLYLRELEKMFGDWVVAKYGSIEAGFANWGNQRDSRDDFRRGIVGLKQSWFMTAAGLKISGISRNRMIDQVNFLAENQRRFSTDIRHYLSNDLHAQQLVIAGNWTTVDPSVLEAIERFTYNAGDVIDRHGYFEPELHQGDGRQSYSVNPGDKYIDTSALTRPDIMPIKFVQNYNMPSMYSEINWPNPNRFRAEFPILLASYASLTGISAPISFAIGTTFDRVMNKFALYTPTGIGQFPAAALIYRKVLVRETVPVVLETLSLQDLYEFKGSFINEDINLDMFRQNY